MTSRSAFQCPLCKQPVPAPPTRMGQVVQCPSCQGEFRLSPANLVGSSLVEEGAKSTAANTNSPSTPVSTNVPSPASPLPPTGAARPLVTPLQPAATSPRSESPSSTPGVSTPLIPTVPTAVTPKKTARLVAAVNAPSTVTLTADGKLPELKLAEAQSKIRSTEKKDSNPLLLIGVFTFSIVCTLLMLFMDPTSKPTERSAVETARQKIQAYFPKTSGTAKPYQVLLQEAERAHNREDRKGERESYQRVWRMLREEGRNSYQGLSGTPSSDRELEELLRTLITPEEN